MFWCWPPLIYTTASGNKPGALKNKGQCCCQESFSSCLRRLCRQPRRILRWLKHWKWGVGGGANAGRTVQNLGRGLEGWVRGRARVWNPCGWAGRTSAAEHVVAPRPLRSSWRLVTRKCRRNSKTNNCNAHAPPMHRCMHWSMVMHWSGGPGSFRARQRLETSIFSSPSPPADTMRAGGQVGREMRGPGQASG